MLVKIFSLPETKEICQRGTKCVFTLSYIETDLNQGITIIGSEERYDNYASHSESMGIKNVY